jgi:hypothetical protein
MHFKAIDNLLIANTTARVQPTMLPSPNHSRTTSIVRSTLPIKPSKNNQRKNNQRDNSRNQASRFPFTFPFNAAGTSIEMHEYGSISISALIQPVPATSKSMKVKVQKIARQLWLANSGCDRMNVLSIANYQGGLAGKQAKYAAYDSD